MIDLQKIEEISKGVDEHLRKLEAFTKLLRDIKASLDEIRLAQERNYFYELQQVKRDLHEVSEQLKKHGLPHSSKYEKELSEIRMLLDAPAWPIAVDSQAICDDNTKVEVRANSILDLLVGEHMKNKRFLDFGCGSGHTVIQAKKRETKLALGYDIDLSNCKFSTSDFTNNFAEVRKKAPFDIILLHDVLDHAAQIDPIAIMRQVKEVIAPNGRVYVRNHPWSSRHGGHLYLQKNRAFMHLIFDTVELSRIGGFSPEFNVGVVTPLETYRFWFAESGFNIITEIPIKDKVEDFFLNPSIVNDRLKKHFTQPEVMINHLEISFIEYVLEPINLNQQIF
jgi:SAM-dependent methyltransferase